MMRDQSNLQFHGCDNYDIIGYFLLKNEYLRELLTFYVYTSYIHY